jgi:DNA-binding Lrp family transcriptional regulator
MVADLQESMRQERPNKRRSSVEHLDKLLDVAQKQARHEKARKEDEAKAEEEAKQKTEVEPETPPVTEEPPEVKTTKPETEPLRLGNKEAWRKVTGKSFHEITLDEYYERRLMGGKLLDDLRDDELKQAAMFHEIEAAAYNRQLEEAAISRRKGFPSTTDLPLIDLPKSKKPNDLFVFLGKVIEQKLGISIDEEVVLSRQHRKIVEQALNQGKRVPQDVLDAYPQLKGELGKQSDEGETSPAQPQAEPLSPDSQSLVEAPGISLAEQLSSIFSSSQEKLSWQDLFRMADVAYGGTQAEGVYSVKQAYDAAELGLNLSLIQIPPQAQDHGKMIKELERRQNKMPTQTKRDKEQLDLQQFSTPHPHSFVAAWVANLNADDVVLEPSAGTGNLVTYAMKAGAKGIIANELSERRGVLLKRLMGNSPGRQVFHENAANINAILPKDIKPTVVLMNPPFSADVNLPGKKKTEVGAKHVEEALKRLEDNGRLVAILGKGMARDKATFKSWWADIEKKYNVRAIIGISGKEYRKFGTSFDNVIAVIDKTGPTRDTVLTGDVEKVEELPPLLEDIRNDRSPQSKRPSTQPTGQAGAGGPGGGSAQRPAIQPATDQTDTGSKTRRPQSSGSSGSAGTTGSAGLRGGSQSEVQPGAVDRPSDRQGEGRVGVAESGGVGSGTPADSGANSDGKLVDQKLGGALGEIEAAEVERKTELQDTTFENYRTPIKIKGAKKHDTPLAESTAMAAVQAPSVTYKLSLPDEVIAEGKLSEVQLEAVVRAGEAHETILPNGQRQGFYDGDGAGAGKGRTAVGIFLDNWNKGRKKHIWVSENQKLFVDATRDMIGAGMGEDKLFKHSATKPNNAINRDEGVMFTTYDTLKKASEGETNAAGEIVKPPRSRIDQIAEWAGEDYDGVIVFDEAHGMKNAVDLISEGRRTNAAGKALAGIALANRLPKARVVYLSATGFTEVSNLAYATRLGLWGEGTAFANVAQFINQVSAGGVAMMEAIAKDLKAMGLYISRALSFEGVEYSHMQHTLTREQLEIHNTAAAAWQRVRAGMEEWIRNTNPDKKGVSAARSSFSTSMQEFFNATITSMQMPSVIEDIQKRLDKGEQAVIQIYRTGKATQDRRLAQAERDGLDVNDINITPADKLIQFLENNFPTTLYENTFDENGNVIRVPVKDSEGNLVDDPDAIAARDELILEVAQLQVPESVLDQLINYTWTVDGEEIHGSDLVAEVTGRDRRVERKDGEAKIAKHGENAGLAQTEEFQKGKRRILVFSEAGGTGRSYHADKDTGNKRRRAHYLLQPGWRADKAVQGLGRSHRTNQYQPPEYILVSTDLMAQRRFLSTIARRLDQLGALTKGSRDTGSQGMFDATMNLESRYGEAAAETLMIDILHGDLNNMDLTGQAITPEVVRDKMGIRLIDEQGGVGSTDVSVRKLLNSMLALEKPLMDRLYEEFVSRVESNIAYAKEQGTFDVGMETVRAQSIVKVDEKTVKSTGRYRGETRYVKLEFTDPTRLMKWKDIQYYAINHAGVPTAPEWHRNRRSGRLYGFVSANNVTDAKTGRMVQRLRRIGVMGVDRIDADQLNNNTYEAVRGSEDQIKALWEQQMEEAPKTQTRTRHLVTGLLLPYFDRLPREDPTIIRLATDEGEVLLGRELPPKKVADTLKKLGISGEAPKLSPAQFFERVLEHGETLMLANGWKVLRRRVSNQNRLELSVQRASSGDYDLLRDMGAFTEVIGHNLRVFIPTADHSVLERVTKAHPVIEIITADGQARRGPVEESSVAVDKIETGLTKQFKTLRQNGFPVEVVETVDNLPVRAYADTKGLYWAGRIFLVAENIGSLKEARRVLAHEAVGHAGLEQMLGKEGFDELVNRVISELDAGNSTLTQAAKAVQKTHGELDNDTLAKEILAHLAENGIQNTFLRRVAARIREWLAKLGLGNLPAAEINSLIARAARFTETSPSRDDRGRFISDTPLFSRDGDPADEGAAFANNRLIQFLKKGQPVDRALRGTFSLGLDITEAEGSKRLKNAFKNAADRLNRREFDDDSSFAWVNPIARYFRAGLVDKYGVDERFIERKEEKKAETRKLNLKAMEFLKNLSEGGVTTRQEWAVIKDVVEGKEIDNERWMKLAAPIRATIDDLGIQAVHLGLLSRESYERLKGVYLHRVYLKHEAQMSGVGNWIAAGMRSRASKIAGNAFKGRGMFDKIEQKRLLRDVDESWWGRRKVDGKADLQLKGAKFIILDDVRQRGEGVDMIEGFDEGGPKPRVVRRVYWPADQAIPDRMADYVNRGTWEIRGTEKGKLILWRDFTKQEREQMGEIVDARYVIAKTFNVLSHDIENAKFFKDIARNKDWTWQDEGLPPSDQIAEPKDPTFWSRTFANAEWVKVPDTTIPKTNGLKAWGDLAGKYVRAEIYRDLQEVRLSMQSNWWKVLMDQWKLLKTARNPVVHMNNVMSNMILMDLLDVRWQDLYQGIKHYRAGDEVYKEAFEAGVFGHSFLDQEIKKQFMDPILDDLIKESLKLGNGSSNTLMDKIRAMDTLARVLYRSGKKIHSADQWAQNLYKAEDEVFRMAAYVRRRELGDTPKQAARVAVRQFLDYDISAPWINNARRTVLPFIAYTYRAAPVIAEAIAARPWKLAKYIILAHIANSLAYMMVPGDEDEERRSLREEEQGWTWMATPRMMRMPYRDRWGNPLFLDIRRWVPAADFFEVREGDAILPTWLHMSGPLAVAFELYLNKDAFTGEEIFDPDLDTTSEALTKLGGHLWRAASTGWAPGGWYWERVGNALRGAEDRSGRQYSLPLALTSSVGIKLKSQDVQAGFESHAFRLDIRLRKLRQELKRAENQYRQNKISKEAFEEQRDRIREKVRRHTEQTRKLIRGK